MSHFLNNDEYLQNSNRGKWLSAKIYSDTKKDCECGGKFTERMDILKVDMPVCAKCRQPPTLLRIRAKIEDESGTVKYVDVRHNKNNERLIDAADCMVIFKQIKFELKAKTFKARDYDSAKARDAFLFKNYSLSYLEFHQSRLERGDLTHYGFKHKQKYVKVLLPWFGEKDISDIDGPMIAKYKNSFTDKFTNRNHSTTELKTILRHAFEMGDINFVPPFGKIPASTVRGSVLTMTEAKDIIPHIENPIYRLMITLISDCALRPCEVRAIQFRDLDFEQNKMFVRRHFSGPKLEEGRKSVKTGKNSMVEFALRSDLGRYALSQCVPLDSEEFIFRSPKGNPIFENTLPKAWRKTLKKLNLPHVQMYELRHAKATEVLEKSNGNFAITSQFLGHSNAVITEKRYARMKADNGRFQEKEADVLPLAR